MSAVGTISSKGQVTVPVEVRRRLGVGAGDQVEFAIEDGRTVLRPFRSGKERLSQWVGAARGSFGSEAEVNTWVAGMRDEDDAAG